MNKKLYSLLVGINDYPAEVDNLYGCVKDVDRLQDYLKDNFKSNAFIKPLKNSDATRDNIEDVYLPVPFVFFRSFFSDFTDLSSTFVDGSSKFTDVSSACAGVPPNVQTLPPLATKTQSPPARGPYKKKLIYGTGKNSKG